MSDRNWDDPDQFSSPWSGVAMIIDIDDRTETTCDIGHVFNRYLDACPTCSVGREPAIINVGHLKAEVRK